ncbi:hypothetical protein PR002_g23922 [Phytophthora rubi]|uniref:Uncharacterized protein n=1 Tax=Phytophthora rubi TaxID=129364 RepID=A0A6A3ING1_9STRA|nr:hypothetical protein PR002_g23922 [Phytophthora rubi]
MARQPNPPTTVSQEDVLRGHVVRLECPYELTGRDWDGPIYAELIEPRHLNPGHRSPFVEDDSVRCPGWLCHLVYHRFEHGAAREHRGDDQDPDDRTVIPFGRLTRPFEDLKDEWRDRPLLMLFRFVRFKTCFLAAADDRDDRGSAAFVAIPLDVYLVGQVVAYRPCSRLTLTTQSGARLRLTASFVCVVADRPHIHCNRRSRSPSPRRGHARKDRDRRSRSRHRDRSRSRSPGRARSRHTSLRLQRTPTPPSRRHAYSPRDDGRDGQGPSSPPEPARPRSQHLDWQSGNPTGQHSGHSDRGAAHFRDRADGDYDLHQYSGTRLSRTDTRSGRHADYEDTHHRARDQDDFGQHTLQQTIEALTSGATSFRLPAAELAVHQIAHVRPRPQGKEILGELRRYWQLPILDRVSAIQHHETLRNRYRVTKVTAKMIFAVNFGTRPLDHFLPPPAQSGGRRSVTHDSATWGSGDTVPGAHIISISDLRRALSRIYEAAVEWYPRPVAEVFSIVHANATKDTLDNAPRDLVYATINLYTLVFTRLFQSIQDDNHASVLADEARATLSHSSPDYIRLVRQVIDTALVDTWARQIEYGSSTSRRFEARSRAGGPQRGTQHHQSRTTVPSEILAKVPKKGSTSICLRFQTQKGCDFPNCKNVHELTLLPVEVFQYATAKHGSFKENHPNVTA